MSNGSNAAIKGLGPAFMCMFAMGVVGLFLQYVLKYPIRWAEYISMTIFYGAVFWFGAYAAIQGKEKQAQMSGDDTDTLMLAGRSVPLIMAVFTMSATWVGGGYIIGAAEYTMGWGLVWVQAPWGYALSLILGGLFFAKKMRRYEFKTMIDPLEQRFGKKMAGLLYIPALLGETFWTAAILSALGMTFGTIIGLDDTTAILISAFVAVGYTALGGLWAVAFTDVIQMILLLTGLFLLIPYTIDNVGGWDAAWSAYKVKKGAAATLFPTKEGLGDYLWNWWDYALLLVCGGVPWHVYFQRVLSSKDEETAQKLSLIAGVVCIIAAVPAIMIGVIGDVADWSLFGLDAAPSASKILPSVIYYMTPKWMAIIGLGAIAAAVMSSVDSSILSASSMAGWNVYRPLVNPKVEPRKLARVIQGMVVIIGAAGTMIALGVGSVYKLWFFSADLVYCILFPQLTLAMFNEKVNWKGALAGFFVAAFIRFSSEYVDLYFVKWSPIYKDLYLSIFPDSKMFPDGENLLPFRTIAMISNFVVMYGVSLLTQKSAPPQPLILPESAKK